MPPISLFSQRNLYFGILGHSLKLLLGQIFLCFARRMVLGPTLNSNSFTLIAWSNFCRYSFNVFNFLSDHQIGNLIVCRLFLFLPSSNHAVSYMCSHHRMNSIFQWSCTFWQVLFFLYIFRKLLHSNLSIFQVIFVTWQSIVFHLYCISAVVIPRDSERSHNEVFSIKYIK